MDYLQGIRQVDPFRVDRRAVPPGSDAGHDEGNIVPDANAVLFLHEQACQRLPNIAET
jgi:hypothetical protein